MNYSRVAGSSAPYSSQGSIIKEFSLRVPKTSDIKYQMMKFNSNLNIDFIKWSHAKMERDSVKIDKGIEEDMPKFGAGSEFGREARQEARRRRYGGNKKVCESAPWNLKVSGKKFRGVREGGITDNSSYYLFTHGEDGVLNAHKLEEWYNFQPVQRYKTLTVEEAEEEFGRRNKVMNHFTLMLQKRLKNEDDDDPDEDDKKIKKGQKNLKKLKISEMDEWENSDEPTDQDSNDDEEAVEKKKKQKKKNTAKGKPKKKSKGSDESATEESDDGDEEGRELDYISDSSDDVSDDEAKVTKEMQGVSEEKALKSLLTSDEEEEEENEENEAEKKSENVEYQNNNSDTEEQKTKKEEVKPKQNTPSKKKKKNLDRKIKKETDSDSESSVDSSDIDSEPIKKRTFNLDVLKNGGSDVIGFSNETSNQSMEPAQKKARLEFSPITMSDAHGITEDAVRRYLSRKPITTTQLVSKFKNRSNLSSEQLVSIIALLLKKINPEKKMIKNKMYLSLKHV